MQLKRWKHLTNPCTVEVIFGRLKHSSEIKDLCLKVTFCIWKLQGFIPLKISKWEGRTSSFGGKKINAAYESNSSQS